MSSQFYTFKGYALQDTSVITASMEDYLEMAYRLHARGDPIRIKSLADNLNVKPSSATKMIVNLKKQGLATSERYGYIRLTPEGLEMGNYLVLRHNIIHDLLCYINQSTNELEQVEKIEHFINPDTVMNMKRMLEDLNPKAK